MTFDRLAASCGTVVTPAGVTKRITASIKPFSIEVGSHLEGMAPLFMALGPMMGRALGPELGRR